MAQLWAVQVVKNPQLHKKKNIRMLKFFICLKYFKFFSWSSLFEVISVAQL